MNKRPWYKRYGGDFVFGTMSLSLEEKGAYSLCLDLIYDRGGPIPDDPRWLAGVCGVSVRRWNALRESLISAGKLVAKDGTLTNARADREIADAEKKAEDNAENGAKGGRKRAENLAKTNLNTAENATTSSENKDLDEARLRPIQKLEVREEKKPPKSPKGAGAFDRFWAAYPSKKAKRAAHLAFDRAVKRLDGADPLEAMLPAIERAKRTDKWRRGFVPNPTTWLNGDCWEDDAPPPKSAGPPKPVTPELQAAREQHYRDTREWKDEWGPKPQSIAA